MLSKFERMSVLKKSVIVLAVMLLLVATLFTACGSTNDGRGEVIGSINGVDVYKGELDYYMNYQFSSYYNQYYSFLKLYYQVDLLDEESASEILGDMEYTAWQYIVEAELILQIAEDYGISFAGEYLKDVLSWGDYRMMEVNSVYNDLFYAVQDELLTSLEIADADAQAKYDADPTMWNGVKTSHILISCDVSDEAAKTAAYEEAAALIEQLNNGADFAELAANNSDDGSAANGGVIDYVFNVHGDAIDGSTSLFEEYVAAAFTLENVGDYTLEPVLSSAGYHIIKLDAVYNDFDSVKDYVVASMKDIPAEDVEAALSEKIETARANAEIKEMTYKYYNPNAVDTTDTADTADEGDKE